MIAKLFEVRDAATFIPVLAVKLEPTNESERYLLGCSGYGTKNEDQSKYIQVMKIAGGSSKSECSPSDWGGNRTMYEAHKYIEEKFDDLNTGDVIDVEYILGISQQPKITQRVAY